MRINLVAILSENYIGETHGISKSGCLKICFRYTGRKEIVLTRDGSLTSVKSHKLSVSEGR